MENETKELNNNSVSDEKQTNCLKRFMRHYLDLFPITEQKLTEVEIKFFNQVFLNRDLSITKFSGKVLTIVNKNASSKSYFALLLTKLPYLSEAKFLTLADILDIQFSNHPQYATIRDIRTPFILIYIESITNRLKDEYLLKAIQYWCMKGRSVWLFYCGTMQKWINEFPKTVEFAKMNRFCSIDINEKLFGWDKN